MKRTGIVALALALALGITPCAWAQSADERDVGAGGKAPVTESETQGDSAGEPPAGQRPPAAAPSADPVSPIDQDEGGAHPGGVTSPDAQAPSGDATDTVQPDNEEPTGEAADAAKPPAVAPAAKDGPQSAAKEEALDQQAAASPVTAVLSKDERTATVKLSAAAASGATAVLFPTWSAANGQDDIVWYVGKKAADGSWGAIVPVSSHRSSGNYLVHAYIAKGGTQSYAGASSFTVSAPSAKVTISQSEAQKKSGVFTVAVSDVSAPSGVSRVQVPVWSTAGGQDDIEWLDAKRRADGAWVVEVSLAGSRRAAGEYNAHVYLTCGNGLFSFVGQATASVSLSPAQVSVTLASDQKTASVAASGGWFSLASSVLFPTWSAVGGQDDISWYAGSKGADGVWRAKIPIPAHGDAGSYAVHAYAMVRGAQVYAGETSFSVTAPSATVSLSQSEAQKKAGVFTVAVSGIKASSGVSSVQIPVWSSAGGQDDIVWYAASRRSDGSWAATVPLAHPRRDVGEYVAHAYVTMGNGVFGYAGETRGSVSVVPAAVTAVLSGDQKTVTMTASGGWFAMASSVTFPVWSLSGGQDDIVWHAARRAPDGVWVANIPVSSHGDAGDYAAHAYATAAGALRFGGQAAFSVKPVSAKVVSATKNDGAGTVTVTVSGISSPSGVARVMVPTWTAAGGQDDIVWYDAVRQGDGSYRVTIPAYRHNGEAGSYVSHAYVTGGNGVTSFVGSVSTTLNLTNYVFVTGSSGSRTVWVRNPAGSPSRVQVPTWSTSGGQDDLTWYSARHVGGGLWRADISCQNLLHSGGCVSHVYADGRFIGSTSFSVNPSEVLAPKYRAMNNRVALLSSPTGYLVAIDNVNCFIGIYKGSRGNWTNIAYWSCGPGAPRTPTVKGLYSVGTRGYVFGSGYSCYYWTQFYGNYLFHSVLYNQGTRVIQDGTLGRQVSHGCVRLNIDHAKWIYDNIPSRTTVLSY